MYKSTVYLALAIGLSLLVTGCDSSGSNNADRSFQITWRQSFDADTKNWVDENVPGPNGGCGLIRYVDSKDGLVRPSAGTGYATVTHGPCNAFHANNGLSTGSGPAGSFGEFKDDGSPNGFIAALDVYLEPTTSAPDDVLFTYAVSFALANQDAPDNLRYFAVPVTMENGAVVVAGHEINGAGWYTFQHNFRGKQSQTGLVGYPQKPPRQLSVEFKLVRDGTILARKLMATTALTKEETASFDLSQIGTGTAWFMAIAPGLHIAIDEQRLLQYE